MAARVSRFASQSIRLWTCSRSKRGTPQRRVVSAICAGPSAASVQTLSAEKRPGERPSVSSVSPITACEEPYMGEESTMPPPALEEGGHDRAALGAEQRIVAHVEGDPASDAHRRHRLSGRRNARGERLCGRSGEHGRRKRSARSNQHRPARHAHEERLPSLPWARLARISHQGHGLRRVQAFDPQGAGRKA